MHTYLPQVILDPKKVALKYSRGWFTVDLISSLPVEYIFLIISSGATSPLTSATRLVKIIRIIKLISLIKLLRISQMLRFFQRWEEVRIYNNTWLWECSVSIYIDSIVYVYYISRIVYRSSKAVKSIHIKVYVSQ